MKQMKQFQEEHNEVYEKSLELAQHLLTNQKRHHRDNSLVTQIKKAYQELKDAQPRHSASKSVDLRPAKSQTTPHEHPSLPPYTDVKLFLSHSIEESNKNIKLSKAGKSSLSYSEKYPARNIKLSKSLRSNTKPLPHVSLISGKTEAPLDLPYYKDYSIQSDSKEENKSVLEKIEKCEQSLTNFYKSINGLEVFCSSNPGVPWNNDKKVLYRLYDYPNYKASIIKAYNESVSGKPKSKISFRMSVNGAKKYSASRSSLDSSPKWQKPATPAAESNLEAIQEIRPPNSPPVEEPEIILERCAARFLNTKFNENTKLINIFTKIKALRPWYLRQKAAFIMHDVEGYKNKLYTLKKFEGFKRKINSRQVKRLKKNKSQAKIYTGLLEYLVAQQEPKELEVSFVELIRKILEDGWILTKELIKDILQGLEAMEVEQLDELLKIIRRFINFEMEDY